MYQDTAVLEGNGDANAECNVKYTPEATFTNSSGQCVRIDDQSFESNAIEVEDNKRYATDC